MKKWSFFCGAFGFSCLALAVTQAGACADDKDPGISGVTSPMSVSGAPTGNANHDPTGGTTTKTTGEGTTGEGTTGEGTTGEGTTGEGTTGEGTTGELTPQRVCELYLNCLSTVSPGELPQAQQGFGPEGTCWQGSQETADQCFTACQTALADLHMFYPDEPKCGLCQESTDCANGGLCTVGECQPPGCGDGVVGEKEVCDGPGCDPDCQGPFGCNPLSLYGCAGDQICLWSSWEGEAYCTMDGFSKPGDGKACLYNNGPFCDPGLVCTPAELIPNCPGDGCCTRLCNVQGPDDCPNDGRTCVTMAEAGLYVNPTFGEYVGICLPV